MIYFQNFCPFNKIIIINKNTKKYNYSKAWLLNLFDIKIIMIMILYKMNLIREKILHATIKNIQYQINLKIHQYIKLFIDHIINIDVCLVKIENWNYI